MALTGCCPCLSRRALVEPSRQEEKLHFSGKCLLGLGQIHLLRAAVFFPARQLERSRSPHALSGWFPEARCSHQSQASKLAPHTQEVDPEPAAQSSGVEGVFWAGQGTVEGGGDVSLGLIIFGETPISTMVSLSVQMGI